MSPPPQFLQRPWSEIEEHDFWLFLLVLVVIVLVVMPAVHIAFWVAVRYPSKQIDH